MLTEVMALPLSETIVSRLEKSVLMIDQMGTLDTYQLDIHADDRT